MRTSSEHYRGQTSRFWCACVYQYFFSSVAFYAPLCVPGSVTVKQVLIVIAVTVKYTYMKYWGALLLNRDLSLLHLSLILNLYLSTKACFTNTQRHQASFLSYFPPLQNPSAVSFFSSLKQAPCIIHQPFQHHGQQTGIAQFTSLALGHYMCQHKYSARTCHNPLWKTLICWYTDTVNGLYVKWIREYFEEDTKTIL